MHWNDLIPQDHDNQVCWNAKWGNVRRDLQLEDSRILREAKEEGRREKALAIALRLLTRRVGALDEQVKERVQQLSSPQLEDLSEALLDFVALADLLAWLETHPTQEHGNPGS